MDHCIYCTKAGYASKRLWPDPGITLQSLGISAVQAACRHHCLCRGNQHVQQQLINISIHALLILLSSFRYTRQGNRELIPAQQRTSAELGCRFIYRAPVRSSPKSLRRPQKNIEQETRPLRLNVHDHVIYDPDESPNHANPAIFCQCWLDRIAFVVARPWCLIPRRDIYKRPLETDDWTKYTGYQSSVVGSSALENAVSRLQREMQQRKDLLRCFGAWDCLVSLSHSI